MNPVSYGGSLVLLVFAVGLVAATHLSTDYDGPIFDRTTRIKAGIQIAALLVAFLAGWQL